jgi:hypothetical protein
MALAGRGRGCRRRARAVFGAVESLRDYPVSSWFGVILYVALLGSVAGLALGLAIGVLTRRC